MDMNNTPEPRMPLVENLKFLYLMGVISSPCTTGCARTLRSTRMLRFIAGTVNLTAPCTSRKGALLSAFRPEGVTARLAPVTTMLISRLPHLDQMSRSRHSGTAVPVAPALGPSRPWVGLDLV